MSMTLPVAPLQSPTSGHKFIVSIMIVLLARTNLVTNPDFSSGGKLLVRVQEEYIACICAIGCFNSNNLM